MAELLFPQRQRCKTCSKGLGVAGAAVLLGLYCSPKCARMAPLRTRVEDAPRGCRTEREGKWHFKKRYRSEQEIPDRLRQDPSTSWYWCTEHCGALHLGHTRIGTAETWRIFNSPQDLADFLIKRRGEATHTQVAKAAGVQPIRLKELENPKKGQRVDLDVLFAVLKVLQSRAGVAVK